MTIQLTKDTYVAGVLSAAGSQHTLDAQTESYLVHIGAATWVETAYTQGRFDDAKIEYDSDGVATGIVGRANEVVGPVWATDDSGNVTGFVGPDGGVLTLKLSRMSGRESKLPIAASPAPTVTFSENGSASLAVAVPYTDSRLSLIGASWTLQAGQARVAPITSDPSGSGAAYADPTTGFAGTSSGAIEFWSDAPTIEIRAVSEYARVYVDQGAGLQIVGTPAGTGGSTRYLKIVWAEGRTPRFYRIELASASIAYFHSVYIAAQDTIWAANADTFKGIAIGDSFVEGSGATYKSDGCFQQLGRLLGIADWRVCGSGGTGFVQTNASPDRGNLQTRLNQDVLLRSPFDLVVLAASGNDTANVATLPAATASILTQIRQYNPSAKIIVLGTWRPLDTAEAAYNALDAAVQSGITTSGVRCSFITQVGWITGAGKIGATTGTGNADFYTSSDGVHPSQAGHNYRAQRMAYEIKRALLAEY